MPHSPPLHPNSCPLQHGRDEGVPLALLTCVPHHRGQLGWTPSPATQRDWATGCIHTCVRTHTRVQEGCQAVPAQEVLGHMHQQDTHPQTHRDAHAGGEPMPGPITQLPRAPVIPKSQAQPCAPPKPPPRAPQGAGAKSGPGAADVPWSGGDKCSVIAPAGRLTPLAQHSLARLLARGLRSGSFSRHIPPPTLPHPPQLGKTNPNLLPVSKQTPSVCTLPVLPHPPC